MKIDESSQQFLPMRRIRPQAVLPIRATAGSAGLDLHACIDEPLTLEPGCRTMIPTGLAAAIPQGVAGMIYARSSLGTKHGIALSNGVGVVDSDYRGEICVGLRNFSTEPYTIQPGERVAQLVLQPILSLPVQEVETLDETSRGEGGFGSTGRL